MDHWDSSSSTMEMDGEEDFSKEARLWTIHWSPDSLVVWANDASNFALLVKNYEVLFFERSWRWQFLENYRFDFFNGCMWKIKIPPPFAFDYFYHLFVVRVIFELEVSADDPRDLKKYWKNGIVRGMSFCRCYK